MSRSDPPGTPIPQEIQEAIQKARAEALEGMATWFDGHADYDGGRWAAEKVREMAAQVRAALSAPPPQSPEPTDIVALVDLYTRIGAQYRAAYRAQFAPPSEGSPPEEKPA